MLTYEFTQVLESNPDLQLQFEIEEGQIIQPTFHITEIKNVSIDSVDCGGNSDAYNHTVVQLMVNPREKLRKPWTAKKALSIFQKVDTITPIDRFAEIFLEYGDSTMRTSNFSIENIDTSNGKIEIQLYTKPTVCKPSLRKQEAASCC